MRTVIVVANRRIEWHFVACPNNEHVTAAETETNQETDYGLTQKSAQGDMAAFEQLYQRHNRRVYSSA